MEAISHLQRLYFKRKHTSSHTRFMKFEMCKCRKGGVKVEKLYLEI